MIGSLNAAGITAGLEDLDDFGVDLMRHFSPWAHVDLSSDGGGDHRVRAFLQHGDGALDQGGHVFYKFVHLPIPKRFLQCIARTGEC